jgi:phosphohistidine phosphatase SixA
VVLAPLGDAVTFGDAHAGGAGAVHVFLVRHAEAQHGTGSDPGLSPKGEGRAYDLARLLSSVGVTHLFATEYQRTQQTLAPLAQESRLEVTVVSARDPEAQITSLRALEPGAVAVVAGHSNTVPTLVQMLGGSMQGVEETQHGLMFDESEFDRLVLVVLQPQSDGPAEYVSSLEMRYGAGPSSDSSGSAGRD